MERLQTVLRAMALAVAVVALTVGSVAAHAGHSHADEGLDMATTLQVAGTILLLGAATLVANRYFRSHERPDGGSGLDRRREE